MYLKTLLAIGLTTALTGCVTPEFKAEGFPTTAATRQIVVQYVRESFKDPYSIRDAEISNSWRTEQGMQQLGSSSYAVCVRMNGKNSYGAYTGRKATAFVINQNKVITSDEDSVVCNDARRVSSWTSFPEVMSIR